MNAMFLIFYHSGYFLLGKPFLAAEQILTLVKHLSVGKIGCVLKCDH